MSKFRRFAPIEVRFLPFGYFPVDKNREEIRDFRIWEGEKIWPKYLPLLYIVSRKLLPYTSYTRTKMKFYPPNIQKDKAVKNS